MISRRRLTLQLTPLLDLLLIVMFSQFIENRDRAMQVQADETRRDQELEDWKAKLADEAEQQFADQRREFDSQRQQLDALRAVYDERFQSLLEQHHQIGSLLAETLNLPGAALSEVLKLRTAGSPDDANRLTSALESLRELMQSRGDEVFRTLVRFDEMQKHVTVWEVHVGSNGQASITDGVRQTTIDFGSGAEFATRLFEATKSFAEPRVLVIVLLSWGDAQAGQRKLATDAMPVLMEQLRRDSAGTHWYDFSILGYRSSGTLLSPTPAP